MGASAAAPASASFSLDCVRCPRLASFLVEVRGRYPGYHARPVPSFGAEHPELLIVGLAPGMHGANATGRPFTGDFAGILLYETLHEFGFASLPTSRASGDGLALRGCHITNAVRCVPPRNKPLPGEVHACNGYLRNEIAALAPASIILALGRVAHEATVRACDQRQQPYPFGHGRWHRLGERRLVDSYHCSRYNTQTGRLTRDMFRAVFAAIARELPGKAGTAHGSGV